MSIPERNPSASGPPPGVQWLGWLIGVAGFFAMLAIGLFILLDPKQGPFLIAVLLVIVGLLGQGIMVTLFYWRRAAVRSRKGDTQPSPARRAAPGSRPAALVDAGGKKFSLGAEAVIGRDPASHLHIGPNAGEAFTSVSHRHARVFQEAESGRYYIEDLDSLNGVFIGDAPTRLNPLQDGDRIRLGGLTLVFQQPGETQGAL